MPFPVQLQRGFVSLGAGAAHFALRTNLILHSRDSTSCWKHFDLILTRQPRTVGADLLAAHP